MRGILTLLITGAVAGCANLEAANDRMNSQAYKECEFQATAAAPTNRGVMADAFRQNDIINACMRAKGM